MSYPLLMRAFMSFVAIACFVLSAPVVAQGSARTLEERLKSINAKTLSASDCASQLAKVATANGPELIYGGRVCEAVGRLVESSFLLSAGQLRALTDVHLLPPATKSDDQSLMPLYAMLYYGGPIAGIDDEVLRDPVGRAKLLKLLQEWSPAYSLDYDPGWNARKRPDPAKYQAIIAEAKSDARRYLDRAIHLVSDDQYYSLHRQFTQLLNAHPEGLRAETPEGKLADDLQKRIRARMIALGVEVGPPPPDPTNVGDVEKRASEARDNFPPASPGKDEVVLAGAADAIVERCTDLAERSAVSQGGKIVRVLATSSTKWETIWRADIDGGDEATRFTCTETTSSSSPREMGNVRIPPLPVSELER